MVISPGQREQGSCRLTGKKRKEKRQYYHHKISHEIFFADVLHGILRDNPGAREAELGPELSPVRVSTHHDATGLLILTTQQMDFLRPSWSEQAQPLSSLPRHSPRHLG